MNRTHGLPKRPSLLDDMRRYGRLLWRWAWGIVFAMLLSGGVVYFISRHVSPIYQATAILLVEQPRVLKTSVYSDVLERNRSIQTYSEMMVKAPVLDGVLHLLNLEKSLSRQDLYNMVQVTPIRDTELLRITVTDTSSKRAADIANAIVSEFSRQIQELQTERYRESKSSLESQMTLLQIELDRVISKLDTTTDLAEKDRLETLQAQYREMYAFLLKGYEEIRVMESQSASSIVPLELAEPPSVPVAPKVFRNTALAVIMGGILAIGFVFLTDALDDTLRDPEDFNEIGLPVLGVIAHWQGASGLAAANQPRAPVTEAYRTLRTNIYYANVDCPIRTLLVTSPFPGDGKTTTVSNLAVVIAQSGQQVTIIDSDLRRPRLERILKVPNQQGLGNIFVQPQVHVNGSLHKTTIENMYIVSAGPLPPNPVAVLDSQKMTQVIQQVAEQSDFVILDSPPVLAVTDACVLAGRVDGVLLVVRADSTTKSALRDAIQQLQHVNAKLLGIVINDVNIRRSSYYSYTYRRYSHEQ